MWTHVSKPIIQNVVQPALTITAPWGRGSLPQRGSPLLNARQRGTDSNAPAATSSKAPACLLGPLPRNPASQAIPRTMQALTPTLKNGPKPARNKLTIPRTTRTTGQAPTQNAQMKNLPMAPTRMVAAIPAGERPASTTRNRNSPTQRASLSALRRPCCTALKAARGLRRTSRGIGCARLAS
jgi:hypothetical protein